MSPEEFRAVVYRMRRAQQEYFKRKLPNDLRAAKSYEREVDRELEKYYQPGLFEPQSQSPRETALPDNVRAFFEKHLGRNDGEAGDG